MNVQTELQDVRTFLEGKVDEHPDRVALVTTSGLEITYAGFDRRVNQAANALLARGVERGHRVSLMLPNCPEYLFMWFGLAKIGAAHVAINTRLTGDPLRYQIEKADPYAVVVHADLLAAYKDACGFSALPALVLSENGTDDFAAEVASAPVTRPEGPRPGPTDPIVIMYTSGTTGFPKGVVNPHNAYVRAGTDLARLMGLEPADRMYVFMPLFHGNPQMMGVMPILAAGGSIALSSWFSASGFWEEVRAMQASIFTHIGSPLPILMKQPPRDDDTDNPIRLILGGAPKDVARAFGERFQCTVLEGWGMIEVGCNTTITPAGGIVPGTNGLPRECFDVRIFDEHDRELPAGRVGEIVVRPLEPYVMFRGYYLDPDRTLDAMRNLWWHTGDLGRKDTDGNLFFLGRADDAIKHKGENISPAEIETVLDSHPAVQEAAIVGIPDPIAGQEIAAFVVPLRGSGVSERELFNWCSEHLPNFMVPRFFRILDEFPRTGSHKIQKARLREMNLDGALDRTAI